ncbi:asparagine synthetase B [Marmoricola endophyticus]|uniref:asparagine synthase (glutamine-hydrolyzing) n=1 Tax=Marmoricola endophyticus TaxID=2040280 RepID=A0A917F0L1_9ACTN|nr:asparagine synthase (glutamine-hydrolyzing) [Marmoricola endophyticus]GGF40383.1 asparagine synthetase B [Marmoricola endophyticus]
MCGLCGWVSFEDDLRRRRDEVLTMTSTMACRGPDDEGLYVREHVALGHRRLAVIDVENGDQPMALDQATGHRTDARAGEGDLAIVYSGETYNFRELREELQAAGADLATRSDTEAVLHKHLRQGVGAVEDLNGMFAYALWDERNQRLHLVRDRLGIKPLYYYPTPDGVLFGSEPKAILANSRAKAVIDEDGLRQVLGFVAVPGEAPYAGMHEVRPGHVVTVDRSGIRDTTYWELESTTHTDRQEETVDTVRELLLDTASRQLISDVPLCSLLSGGLDSSALSAMAARGLAERGEGPLRTFSVDFEGYDENFEADDMRATPDGPYVTAVAEHIASDHQRILLNNDSLLDPGFRAAVLRSRDLPGMGEMDTSLYLLFKAVREQSTVALSGESADEVFGGYKDFHDPEAVNAGTFPWMRGMAKGRLGSTILSDRVAERLDLDGYVAAQYDATMAEVPRLEGETGHEARMREVCYSYLTRFLPNLLDRKDRMSMAVGLEVRVPFCDHRLVQYVFNTPWSLKTFDGREKSLLRAATADLLPESVVQRVKSPYPATQDPGYLKSISEDLLSRVEDDSSPLSAISDRRQLLAVLDKPDHGTQMLVDRMLNIDDWMREYDVDLQM